MKKILLTGVSGQVGHALREKLTQHQVIALTRSELDMTDGDNIRRIVRETRPDLIINPAAYTAVDKAENEVELAYALNAIAPKIIAEEAARLNVALIHFSTDYVYDGFKKTPYEETDTVNPSSVYGKSKLAGENAVREVGLPHLILRTSWVYGPHGKNFLKTILKFAMERDSLRVVADQIGAPTSSLSIAEAVTKLIDIWQVNDLSQTGIYHLTNTSSTSWHGFACEIIDEYNTLGRTPALKTSKGRVVAIPASEYPRLAERPANSIMDNSKLKKVFGVVLPSWQHGLNEVMQKMEV